MSGMVKVTEVLAGYAFDGKVYGPFKANKDKPFLEVPVALANALNLSLHESEVQAREETAQSVGDGADVEQLLQANHSLKADLDQANRLVQERDQIIARGKADNERLVREANDLREHASKLNASLATLTGERDALKARVAELEASASMSPTLESGADALAEQPQGGTPLPESTPLRDLLTEHGFDTLEKLEAGLVVAEGQAESPVRQLDGVGGKTEDAYKALVAEWRQGQAN